MKRTLIVVVRRDAGCLAARGLDRIRGRLGAVLSSLPAVAELPLIVGTDKGERIRGTDQAEEILGLGGSDEILEVRREIFREVLARAAVCKRWG